MLPGPDKFVHYSMNDTIPVREGLEREAVVIFNYSLFVGLGFVQDAGAGLEDDLALSYEKCTILGSTT